MEKKGKKKEMGSSGWSGVDSQLRSDQSGSSRRIAKDGQEAPVDPFLDLKMNIKSKIFTNQS